jgi:bifunctional non-homologous end joining protein LigD
VNCVRKGRFPIVGFIPDVGGISALYLGKREGRELIYAGKVGSGFSQKASMSVRKKLEPLVTKESRLTRKVRKPKVKWVEPKFLATVEYRDITAEGLLRQSAFKGMDEA